MTLSHKSVRCRQNTRLNNAHKLDESIIVDSSYHHHQHQQQLTRAGAGAGDTEGTGRVGVVVVGGRVRRRAGRVVGGRVVEVAERRQVLLGGGSPHALFQDAGVQTGVAAAAHQGAHAGRHGGHLPPLAVVGQLADGDWREERKSC